MSKPQLTVIEGGKLDVVEVPESQEFDCPTCGGACIIYPRTNPMAVQHSLPTCKGWQRVEAKTDHLEGFLTKAGMHLLIPKADA